MAAAIARRTGGAVTLVHAVRPPAAFALAPPSALVPAPDDLERAARAEGEALVREVTGPLAAAVAGAVVEPGDPARLVLATARRLAPDLVVLGARPRSAARRLALGSTSATVCRQAAVPVLVVPTTSARVRAQPLLAVGVEAADAGLRTVRSVVPLARALGARLTLVHVRPPAVTGAVTAVGAVPMTLPRGSEATATPFAPGDDGILEALAADGVPALAMERDGDPADVLLRVAAEQDADALVVARRDQGLFADLLLGSVTAHAVAAAERPVLVVPPRCP